jgi:hypothetical protein
VWLGDRGNSHGWPGEEVDPTSKGETVHQEVKGRGRTATGPDERKTAHERRTRARPVDEFSECSWVPGPANTPTSSDEEESPRKQSPAQADAAMIIFRSVHILAPTPSGSKAVFSDVDVLIAQVRGPGPTRAATGPDKIRKSLETTARARPAGSVPINHGSVQA